MPEIFYYGQDRLSPALALELARGSRRGALSHNVVERVKRAQAQVAAMVAGHQTIYGVNTGFGPLCATIIPDEALRHLQHNLLRSHSVGVGEMLDPFLSTLMLVLKAQALAQGYSGVALSTLERILWHLDNGVIPCVPRQGSVGASGDLAPLAHLFLPLIGEGEALHQGRRRPAADVLRQLGAAPLELGPKEGLALINGTQFIAAHAVSALARLHNCLEQADLIAAMSLEALLGSARPFSEDLHQLRPFAGIQYVAARLRAFLDGSAIVASHANCARVQDPYSLRCIPQVHGATRNAWLHLKELTEVEINSVTDNPVIINEKRAVSGGNFHGQPLALPLDYLAFAAAELGSISERRVNLLLEGKIEGLPKLLIQNSGLHSGFMITQYTAAALVSENKTLCFPASADSIPTGLGQEDHVSMGAISGRKTLRIIENVEKIIAIEWLCAAQALDFRRPLHSTPYVERAYSLLRDTISFAQVDRVFGEDMERAIRLLRSGQLLSTIKEIEKQQDDAPGAPWRSLFDLGASKRLEKA
jgi:histidine ammonia-lyase